MHSSRNSNVSLGSLCANFSETLLINNVLFDGMHNPHVSKSCPCNKKLNYKLSIQ